MIPGLPFAWHLPALAAIVLTLAAFWTFSLSTRRRVEVLGVLLAATAVLAWPMGSLAQSVSLSAAVIQRLVLMVLVVPVLLRAIPSSVVERLTRPRIIDAVSFQLSRPLPAIVAVTVVGTLTLVPVTINWAARSWIGNGVVIAATVACGVVLWIPALVVLPGSQHLSPAGRAGYVFVAALVVTSFSLVWIFATHPLYSGLHGQEEILGITPLFDQQLAGFIAKLGAYGPLWAVSFVIFMRADVAAESVEETPLHWADVERHLLRADRRRERSQRRGSPG